MAQIEIWYEQDLQKQVPVHKLDFVFNEDSQANKIGVKLYDNGEALSSVSGSVTGYFLLADGTTTSISGSKSGNMVSVVVPPAAYKVTGPITITIRVTDGSNITTVCACVGAVMLSKTPVATPAGSTVSDWSAQISAQLQACQDASDNVGATLAVPYASLTFPVTAGTYTYYDGGVYYANQDISSSEEWTSDHWTQTKVFDEIDDLKSDVDTLETNLALKAPKASPVFTGSISLGRTGTAGDNSIAVGKTAKASGARSASFGENTKATGNDGSLATGFYSTASGVSSVAHGSYTTAEGANSFASGLHTIAKGRSQFVFGEYNAEDPDYTPGSVHGRYAEIVGNGTYTSVRSNARTLDWSGNEELAGDLTINKGTANEVSVSELKSAIDSIFALMQANGWNVGT